jgi:hypothetical protein
VEWLAMDLIRNEAGDGGCHAIEMETGGRVHIFEAKKTTLLATCGAG